jgi:hypothetical protein
MKIKAVLRVGFAVLIIAVGVFVISSLVSPDQADSGGETIRLQKPPFLSVASAKTEAADSEIGAKLDEEAGISAYYQTDGEINLNTIRDLFSTIELDTSDYLIGSIPVPDYPEIYDTHVYVHKDGWILAYYFKDDPVSKFVDIKNDQITTTTLESVVAAVAGAAGMSFTGVSYYDFRYPNATHILFVGEDLGTYSINLTSSYGYNERSFALHDTGYGEDFVVDGKEMLNDATYWNGAIGYGFISAADLLPDTEHTIITDNYGVLVILYREP